MKLTDFEMSSNEVSGKRWITDDYARLKNTICLRFTKAGLYFNKYTGDLLDCDWIDFHINADKKMLAIIPATNEAQGYKFRNYSNDYKMYRLAKGVSKRIYETIMNDNYKSGAYCIGAKLEDEKGIYFDFNEIIQVKDKNIEG